MGFILVIFSFLLIFSSFLSNFKLGRFLLFIITYSLLICIFGLITYTPDRAIYEWWLFNPAADNKEPTFKLISAYIRSNNLDYQFFHVTFIGIYSFLLLYFINKTNKNVLLISILYLPLIFIFHGTQLRYFLGYYAMLLGIYYLVVSKNRVLAILCFVFAISSHYSLVLFIPFYFLLKIKDNFFQKIVRLTIIILVSYSALTTIVFKLLSGVRFLAYLEGDLVSSFAGGIFSFAPIIPIYFLTHFYYKKRIALDPNLENDPKFEFLYKMSINPMVFVGVALTAQVIGHRIMMTGMLFPILLFFYKYNLIKNMHFKVTATLIFILSYIMIFVHFNFSTGLFLGEWQSVEEVGKMLKSNSLIKDFLN